MSNTSSQGLYKKGDGVVILTDQNFQGKGSKVKITSGCVGAGVLKAYATWCPHCVNKVTDFKELAADFKKHSDLKLSVYTIEAHINSKFAKDANIEGFPTILYVDENGEISPLLSSSGSAASNIAETIGALCESKQKCLKRK